MSSILDHAVTDTTRTQATATLRVALETELERADEAVQSLSLCDDATGLLKVIAPR